MRKRFFGRCLLTAGIGGMTTLALSATPSEVTPPPASPAAQSSGAAAASGPADPNGQAGDEHWAFLKQYCSKCHNAEDWAGGVAFDTMSAEAFPDDAKIWEHAMVQAARPPDAPAGQSAA